MNLRLSKFFRAGIIVLVVGLVLLVAKVFTLEHRLSVMEKSLIPHVAPVK